MKTDMRHRERSLVPSKPWHAHPLSLPQRHQCHTKTPSIFHIPGIHTATSLMAAQPSFSSLLRACTYARSYRCAPILFDQWLHNLSNRTTTPDLLVPSPPMRLSASPTPVAALLRSFRTLRTWNLDETCLFLCVPLPFNVSTHLTWMGSFRILVFATSYHPLDLFKGHLQHFDDGIWHYQDPSYHLLVHGCGCGHGQNQHGRHFGHIADWGCFGSVTAPGRLAPPVVFLAFVPAEATEGSASTQSWTCQSTGSLRNGRVLAANVATEIAEVVQGAWGEPLVQQKQSTDHQHWSGQCADRCSCRLGHGGRHVFFFCLTLSLRIASLFVAGSVRQVCRTEFFIRQMPCSCSLRPSCAVTRGVCACVFLWTQPPWFSAGMTRTQRLLIVVEVT